MLEKKNGCKNDTLVSLKKEFSLAEWKIHSKDIEWKIFIYQNWKMTLLILHWKKRLVWEADIHHLLTDI